MVVFEKIGCIRAKVVVLGHMSLYSSNVFVFGQKWFHSAKSGCFQAK